MALRAWWWSWKCVRSSSSHSRVAKKLSAMALSKQSPTEPIDGTTPHRRQRSPKAKEVDWQPWSGDKADGGERHVGSMLLARMHPTRLRPSCLVVGSPARAPVLPPPRGDGTPSHAGAPGEAVAVGGGCWRPRAPHLCPRRTLPAIFACPEKRHVRCRTVRMDSHSRSWRRRYSRQFQPHWRSPAPLNRPADEPLDEPLPLRDAAPPRSSRTACVYHRSTRLRVVE